MTIDIVSKDQQSKMCFVPERGGAAVSLNILGRELLYVSDQFWKDKLSGWPFLFPVCARLSRDGKPETYLYQGQLYQMGIHGFAHLMPWEVILRDSDRLQLKLTSTPDTLEQYPFHFEVILDYHLQNNQLICQQTYKNLSDDPMPYYAGFHPYILTPLDEKDRISLSFSTTGRFKYNDSLTDVVGHLPALKMPICLTDPAINEQLSLTPIDNTIQMLFPDGFQLSVKPNAIGDKNAFSYLQLYTIADQPFFCIEPWMGYPNAMNAVSGVRWLSPHTEESFSLRLEAHMLSP